MKIENNQKGFSTIEILFIIVIASVVLIAGIAIVFAATNNAKINTFKDTANSILVAAKNSYATIKKSNESEIISSTDGSYKGMCITLKGLKENGFYSEELTDWNGYIVVEEKDSDIKYSLWLTDKEYVIAGYELSKLADLNKKNGITEYKNEDFTSNVKNSFTGTTKDKGGTGSVKYEKSCINEKIE